MRNPTLVPCNKRHFGAGEFVRVIVSHSLMIVLEWERIILTQWFTGEVSKRH